MIRPCSGLFLSFGMLLFIADPAVSSPTPAAQYRGSRSEIGLLPLEVAQIQREADYTREHNPYFNPTVGMIAIGIGALLGLAWFFGGERASQLRGDPVPSRVRSRLDRLDGARLAVLAATRASKSVGSDAELSAEKTLYDRLAADVDEVLDKVRRDLLLNLVDEDFLVPALDELTDRAHALSFRLRRIAPVRSMISDEKTSLQLGHATLARVSRGWERVLSAEPQKMTTIRQLNAMRWPSWSRIAEPSRRPV